ncbi:MAG: hypothetical protein SFU99_12945 [Saprospiraceae bacterium]|nr:hypothetical protein [Saprospiraceae bacterium]
MVIEKLPAKLSNKHYDYELVKRTNQTLMYKHAHGYEVFTNKIVPKMGKKVAERFGFKFKESVYTHKEAFPKDEEFGVRAFYTANYVRAIEIFDILEGSNQEWISYKNSAQS